GGGGGGGSRGPRGSFSRPSFLQLTPEELLLADDHTGRTVQSPRESRRRLPWSTGYAEVINAGKSQHNEDQACCEAVFVEKRDTLRNNPGHKGISGESEVSGEQLGSKGLFFYYWGLFDGHAGSGAAIMASKLLHFHIRDQLQDLVDILQDSSAPPICLQKGPSTVLTESSKTSLAEDAEAPNNALPRFHMEKVVSRESLVVGAIENAFKQMVSKQNKNRLEKADCFSVPIEQNNIIGRVLAGQLVQPPTQAGDLTLFLVQQYRITMGSSMSPKAWKTKTLGYLRPELLGNEFTYFEFPRRIQQKEVGKKMLYRDQNMNGWAYKRIEEDDLKFPLVYGEGKKARMMATIGVTRGLGDHDLKVCNSNIHIKPFLSCTPEVHIYDLTQYEHCPDDVLVLGTDGLWDVTSDQEVATAVTDVLMGYEPNDPCRYTMAAQELVMRSRGVLKDRGWRLANDKLGSGDDISVFVIPLGGPGNYS
uniref:Protein phosphatase, Mg2+/Mn2+ dependent 1J n=1 Tax=Pseudonaja textilis TaxID=8673 RepID=A0A670YME6_PSETE